MPNAHYHRNTRSILPTSIHSKEYAMSNYLTIEIPDHPDSYPPAPRDPYEKIIRLLNIVLRVLLIVILIFVGIIPNWETIKTSAYAVYEKSTEYFFPPQENVELEEYMYAGDYACGTTWFTLKWKSSQPIRAEVTCDGNIAVIASADTSIQPIVYSESARITSDGHALVSAEGVCSIEDGHSYCRYGWGYVYEQVSVLESAYANAEPASPMPAPIQVIQWSRKDCRLDHYISQGTIGTEITTIHGEYTAPESFRIHAQSDSQITIALVIETRAIGYRITVDESGQVLSEGTVDGDFRGDSLIAHLSNGDYIFVYIPWLDGFPNHIVYSVAPTLEGGGCSSE